MIPLFVVPERPGPAEFSNFIERNGRKWRKTGRFSGGMGGVQGVLGAIGRRDGGKLVA